MAERGIAGVRISYPLIKQGGTLKRVMELIEKSVSFIRKHEKDWKLDSSCFGFCEAWIHLWCPLLPGRRSVVPSELRRTLRPFDR